MKIRARNNLDIPIRLTLTVTHTESEILITIGEEGAKLAGFYSVCSDTDLLPAKEWQEIGSLDVENRYKVSIAGIK